MNLLTQGIYLLTGKYKTINIVLTDFFDILISIFDNNDSIKVSNLGVNNIDLEWGLAVSSVGTQLVTPGTEYPPIRKYYTTHYSEYLFSPSTGRVLNEYQLLYITEGKGFFWSSSTGNEAIDVKAGDMFLLFPGEWHSYMPDKETGWKEYWIAFNGSVVDSRAKKKICFDPAHPVFDVGLQDKMIEMYLNAIEIAMQEKSGFQIALSSIAEYLLSFAFFLDRNRNVVTQGWERKVIMAKGIMTENLADNTPEKVAEALSMGYSNFRKLFKKYTGFAPNQYILNLKITKAKELLSMSDAPIKSVVSDCGFSSYEYFFRAFRKKEKMTPDSYRQMTRFRKKE